MPKRQYSCQIEYWVFWHEQWSTLLTNISIISLQKSKDGIMEGKVSYKDDLFLYKLP